ncbi:hypothetical protein B0O99DRAFT_552959 [Bisporella sp. PMI_857]|nr:hypothetical protein B0O99DRAFT_552959 [Bisporella sp. PMI_857]
MSAIKKVALVGATGTLGPTILKVLLESKLFEITVLTRESSNHSIPGTVVVKPVDYGSNASLVAALQGQDALISVVSATAIASQKNLIDAAISAGVKRFIPSEFGSIIHNPPASAIPIFAPKIQIQKYLKQKAAEVPGFSYTSVFNGPLLDWCLSAGLLVDVKHKKAELVDGGDVVFSATRLAVVGHGVVSVLSYPKETANRSVVIKDIDITQRQIINIAKELDPSGSWSITNVSSATQEQEAYASLAKGEFDSGVFMKFLFRCIYGEGYGGRFEVTDNKTLGINGLDEVGLKALVKSTLEA